MYRETGHTEHNCNIKGKLAALAQEIKLWEDDVRHSPTVSKLSSNPMFKKPAPNHHVRESLANLDIVPVATMKARFESLSSAGERENKDPLNYLKPPLVTSITKPAPKFFSPLIKSSLTGTKPTCTVAVDFPRSSVSNAERARLERMNELANLRQRSEKRETIPQFLPSPPTIDAVVGENRLEQESVPTFDVPVDTFADVVDADYALPPPPVHTDSTDAGDTIKDTSVISTYAPDISDNGGEGDSEAKLDEMDSDVPDKLPVVAVEEHSSPVSSECQQSPEDFFLPSGPEDGGMADDSASSTDGFSKHTYYSRPPFSSKRRHDEAADPALPRQRSVTFVPPHGAAPGDTTSEGTACDVDSEMESTDTDCRPLYAGHSPDSLSSYEVRHVVAGGDTADSRSATSCETAAPVTSEQPPSVNRRMSSGLTDAHRRRRDRLAQLPILLEAERHVILQASAALQQCAIAANVNPATASGSSSILAMTPKRSRLHPSHVDSSSTTGSHVGPGSVAHVEASRMLLIACQRRQVLMEELTVLENNATTLVPPIRGEPIRARLKLAAIRLGLKTLRKPGTGGNGNDASGGGFVVVNQDTVSSVTDRHGLTGAPLRYHIIAVLKCRGEGRMFPSQMVTLMHFNDLPVGTARPVDYVDLPANVEIVPLRPDFTFTLEVYCLTVGSDSVRSLRSGQSPQLNLLNTPEGSKSTPRNHHRQRGRITGPAFDAATLLYPPAGTPLTRSSKRAMQQFTDFGRQQQPAVRRRPDAGCKPNVLSACIMQSSMSPPGSTSTGGSKASDSEYALASMSGNKMAAFTLLSSVDMHYHDDLLVGRFRASTAALDKVADSKTQSSSATNDQMPLSLARLPRSSPLSGPAGLVSASVGLEARIMNRGFITVFEEVGGLGIWRRYWCQLRADHLQFWRYPEEEQRSPGPRRASSTEQPPVCRIDLRHVVAPRAIPAPHHICARTNSIYMRSIRTIEPDCLSASINAVASQVRSKKAPSGSSGVDSSTFSNESLIFRASSDHAWLEQKHLLCADTLAERDHWIRLLNTSMGALKQWMPEHFTCLSRLDDKLDFCQPVSSNLAALLIHGGARSGTDSAV